MTDLAAFVLAQIAADERAARAAIQPDQLYPGGDRALPPMPLSGIPEAIRGYLGGSWGEHFARWDPVRVLTDCAARRCLVDRYQKLRGRRQDGDLDERRTLHWVLEQLATRYANHPDYREAWRS